MLLGKKKRKASSFGVRKNIFFKNAALDSFVIYVPSVTNRTHFLERNNGADSPDLLQVYLCNAEEAVLQN